MTNAIEEAREALKNVQALIAEGAAEGFNLDRLPTGYGERLFLSNAKTSRALAALSAPTVSGLSEERAEGLGLAHQTPMQDVEIEYWLNQADNYAEVPMPCDDLRSLIARALSPAPGIDWKRVGETPDYDAGLLNDWGGGNVDWWQDYIRAEVGRANEYWRSIVTAMGGDDGQ